MPEQSTFLEESAQLHRAASKAYSYAASGCRNADGCRGRERRSERAVGRRRVRHSSLSGIACYGGGQPSVQKYVYEITSCRVTNMVKRMRVLVDQVWSKCKKDRTLVKSNGKAVGGTLGATLKRLQSKPRWFKNTVFNDKLRAEVRKIDKDFEELFFATFPTPYFVEQAME